jgi:hypothetical protein
MQQHRCANANGEASDSRDDRLVGPSQRFDEAVSRKPIVFSGCGASKISEVVSGGKCVASAANSTTRIAWLFWAVFSASVAARYMALVSAFFFSGRAKVISRTLPACLILMCSVICKLHRAIQVTVSNNVRHDDLTRSSCHLDCRHRLLIEESNEATANINRSASAMIPSISSATVAH